jgi:hypothetical protein
MKTQLINIIIFSFVLIILLSFYFVSNISFISLKNLGFIIGILFILYFLFINVTLHFVDFKDNLKLKRYKIVTNLSLKESVLVFFSILIIISFLTYLNAKFVQLVPFFINREYNSLIIMGILILLFFQQVQKHSTSAK